MVGKERSSLLSLSFLATQSNVLFLVTFHPGRFGAQFGLDEEPLIEVVFLLCLMQHPCNALLDRCLFCCLLLAAQILVDPFGVSQRVLEETFIACLLEEWGMFELGEYHGGLAGGLGEGEFRGECGATGVGVGRVGGEGVVEEGLAQVALFLHKFICRN